MGMIDRVNLSVPKLVYNKIQKRRLTKKVKFIVLNKQQEYADKVTARKMRKKTPEQFQKFYIEAIRKQGIEVSVERRGITRSGRNIVLLKCKREKVECTVSVRDDIGLEEKARSIEKRNKWMRIIYLILGFLTLYTALNSFYRKNNSEPKEKKESTLNNDSNLRERLRVDNLNEEDIQTYQISENTVVKIDFRNERNKKNEEEKPGDVLEI